MRRHMFKSMLVVSLVIFVSVAIGQNVASSRQGRSLVNEGVTLIEQAKSSADLLKAREKLEMALKLFERSSDQKGIMASLLNMGTIENELCNYAKALEYYEKSLEITRKIGDVKGEGPTLNSIGLVYVSLGQYSKALEYYEKSILISRKFGNVSEEVWGLIRIGGVYNSWGQYSKALEYNERSLEIARRARDLVQELGTLNNIGLMHLYWGNYAKALNYFEKSLEIASRIGNVKGEDAALNNIGLVYKSWGQYARALECFDKDFAITMKSGDVRNGATTLFNIAQVCMTMGDYDQALVRLREALAIYTRLGVPTDETKKLIGEVHLEMGDISKAERFIREVNYDSSAGLLALKKSEFRIARDRYEKLLKSAEQNRNADDLFAAYTGLGMVHESLGDYPSSEGYYRKGVNSVEVMRTGVSPSERENFFSVKINGFCRTDPYEGLARVLAKMNRPVEALKQSEYTKARLFSEALSKNVEGARIPVPREVLEKDSSLTDQLAALTKNLHQAYEKGNKEVIASLEPQVKEKKSQLASHIDLLRKQYPLYAATKYPQPMDLSQTALKDNEWCLAYDVTDSGLLVYLTKGKDLIKWLFKPVPKKDLEELVRKVREPLEVIHARDLTTKLKAFDLTGNKGLSDILLGEVLSYLPQGVPVTIVPSGCLGVLPFEMLVLNTGGELKTDGKIPYVSGAEFFGDRNTISYHQSITALTLARTLGKQQKPQEKLLVVADPVFEMKDARAQEKKSSSKVAGVEARLYEDLMASVEDGKVGGLRFGRLPLTGDLASDLNSTFSGSCTLFTGLKASKDTFNKEVTPQLHEFGKVVFATHGYTGKGLPGLNEPVLVLTLVPPGTDGYLRMSEVMGLKMNAEIVALTACQTGLGRELSGEGVMGMGRAFQFAGAKSVLMSLWSVSEKSSVTLVESFFRNLKEGKSKLESLKIARNEIRKQGYDHPFFWAGFILVGETD